MTRAVAPKPPEILTATPLQFSKALLRMMPGALSGMPEAKLVASIFTQAWEDAPNSTRARLFFLDRAGRFDVLCDRCGLDSSQVQSMYVKHNRHHRELVRERELEEPI